MQLDADGTVKIMAYIQKNNPVPKTGCGRRRLSGMKNPFKFGLEDRGIDSAARGTKAIGPDGQPLKMKGKRTEKKHERGMRTEASRLKPPKTDRSPEAQRRRANRGNEIKKLIDKSKDKSPMKAKISPSCKARAKKKFKVWPSAYASGWGVRCTKGQLKK